MYDISWSYIVVLLVSPLGIRYGAEYPGLVSTPSSTYAWASKDYPVVLAIRKARKLALRLGISKSEEKKASEDAAAEEESKCLSTEAAVEGENKMRGNEQ